MRNALMALAAFAGVLALGSGSASAKEYRYCLVESNEAGPGTCYYNTYAQCAASASGRRAYCQLNPVFAFAAQQPQRRPRRVYREY